MSIMKQARARNAFQRPDISQFIPPGQEDTVARVAAAGQRLMYAPGMRDELNAEVERDAPVTQKMAESVTGLMLTLDQQTPGGIPQEALFPAALDLLSEAAEVLSQAGDVVTADEYNEAALLMFVMMSKKLGIPDDDIMGAAEKAAGVAEEDAAAPAREQGAAPPDEPEPDDNPTEEASEGDDEEEAAMQEGFR